MRFILKLLLGRRSSFNVGSSLLWKGSLRGEAHCCGRAQLRWGVGDF